MNSNKEIYFVLQFAVVFVKGKLSVRGFEGRRVSWSPTILCVLIVDCPPGVPLLRCVTADCLLR